MNPEVWYNRRSTKQEEIMMTEQELKAEIVKKLVEIHRNKTFVMGILCALTTEAQCKAFYEYLESDAEAASLSPHELMTKALSIANLDLTKGEDRGHHHHH